MRTWLFVSALAVAGVASCSDDPTPAPLDTTTSGDLDAGGGEGGPSEPTPGCGPEDAPTGYLANQSVQAAGQTRSYHVFVPPAHDGKKTFPLVFVLHGSGGDGAGIRSYFKIEAAANGGGIFVYPDGNNRQWNLNEKAAANEDIALFDAIVAKISASHCVDKQRIFATGFSNGGYFSNQLGCRRGSVLRAIVSHAGGGPFGNGDEYNAMGNLVCPESPVAALIIHGESDGAVQLSEGTKSRDHWRRVNNCQTSSSPSAPSPCVAYAGCAKPVKFCQIGGLGHEIWSSGASATWSFFSSF